MKPLALIDLNAGRPNLGVAAIESQLLNAGIRWVRLEPRVAGELPTEEIAGAILTGGPGSPMEALPWRHQTLSWLEEALTQIPVLGICMGCQLLATVHGWMLQELEHPRFGIYPIGLTAAGTRDRVLGALNSTATVFEQRRWGIEPGAGRPVGTALARSETGEATALRFGPGVLGTIFHPEASPAPVRRWIQNDEAVHQKLVQRHGPDGVEQQLSRCAGLGLTWDRIIPAFLAPLKDSPR